MSSRLYRSLLYACVSLLPSQSPKWEADGTMGTTNVFLYETRVKWVPVDGNPRDGTLCGASPFFSSGCK